MPKYTVIFPFLLILGALLWNGWILGFLNHGSAGYLHMSISELEVKGQPYGRLFDILEVVSGILIMVGSLGIFAHSDRKSSILTLILLGAFITGALTLYDVAHPLSCNSYNNPVCVTLNNANKLTRSDVLHNDESRITAYITIAVSIMVGIWVYYLKDLRHFAEFMGLGLVALGVFITLAIINANDGVLINAVSERVWNLLVSVAFIYLGWKLIHIKNKTSHHKHKVLSN